MKRLEIIHLRFRMVPGTDLIKDVCKSLKKQEENVIIRVYRHATVSTDLGIHLHLNAVEDDLQVKQLGLRLASALKEFGLVEHTIWVEEQV